MKTVYLAVAVMSALSMSAPANAGFFDFTLAPFVGASAGRSNIDVTCPVGSACDDTDTAWKVYGGLEVNEFISMEVGYVDLGEATLTGVTTGSAEVNGMTIAAVGTYAITPNFTLLGRGGMNILNLEINKKTAGVSSNSGDTDVAWSLGLGAQYNLNKSLGFRVEYERFYNVGDADTTGESDVDLISAGLVYSFR